MLKDQIAAQALERKVPYLLHFTRSKHLPSIIANGLYPRSSIHALSIKPHFNDAYRIDGHLNSSSLSIGHPNSSMFYKLRLAEPDEKWVVLIVEKSVLWTKQSAFYKHNAADNKVRHLSIENLRTLEAFRGIYDEIEGKETRQQMRLKSFDPTDLQAEVLVTDVIEPKYLIGAIFSEPAIRDLYSPLLDNHTTAIHANGKGMFAGRDYARRQ
jgi:hypothetical protein